ncbi:hypothetical protein [Sphingomonas glaciei]|uniref:Uncharacterized protein n=1 Tax=Sphingomonas glaciei TaxID=2938948 RepID=A0ABY5MZF2_9SPHN|nr:hypothetical protein [Sphingomonas glaciei]UUR08687.1 hypothetical protein M1K48_03350 [Sphingomonas glaciei]
MATDPHREANRTIGDFEDPCQDSGVLQAKAARCRRLAAGISDRQAADVLKGMAQSYQDAADRLTSLDPRG